MLGEFVEEPVGRRLGETAERGAMQAVTLLHATLAAIGSVDVKLRVFCYR